MYQEAEEYIIISSKYFSVESAISNTEVIICLSLRVKALS